MIILENLYLGHDKFKNFVGRSLIDFKTLEVGPL